MCQPAGENAINYSPLVSPLQSTPTFQLRMSPDQFWTSQDGQILTVKNKDERTVSLTLAFWPRNPIEFEFIKNHLPELKFTERSSLARIGIEMLTHGSVRLEGNRFELDWISGPKRERQRDGTLILVLNGENLSVLTGPKLIRAHEEVGSSG